jgi:energy-coupling factor transport system ATP-binding protein
MRRDRLATLRTAVLLGAGFVVLRVVYRLVFGGGAGDGILLLDLPTVPLGGPFAGIVLLGPVTTGGIAAAALGALPFAGVVVGVGLLAAVVDLRALLARGAAHGPFRAVARVLVVAWSTFPALRDAVLRVRVARELRGERSIASLLVPVLEQTVERAIALGASMEVRGFAATRHPEPDRAHPAVLTDAALGFDGRWVLDPVDLRVAPGTLTLISGPTGSGKSTLLQALSGLFQHLLDGDQDGTVTVGGVDRLVTPPRETAGFVGAVSQSVRLSFVAPTVAEEIGFALAVRGVAAETMSARTGEVAQDLGIEHLLDRETRALSAGEACLVSVAAALVLRPLLLLVDEPLADLDTAARDRVVGVLAQLAHRDGVGVVVAEHSLAEWDAVADVRLEVRDGTLAPAHVGPALPAETGSRRRDRRPGPAIAEVRGLSVRHGERHAVEHASLSLAAGEIVALTGPNGAGKSSLLHAIARPAESGAVTVRGADVRALRRGARRRAVALVPEAFDDLLFATTVAAECRRADRHAPAPAPGAAETFRHLLGADPEQARRLLDRHPRDLSAGERLCLVIAIQLSARPVVLLVDEPTRGLDAAARALVGDALLRAAAAGSAVLVATHDRAFAARYADRAIAMSEGRITEPVAVGA